MPDPDPTDTPPENPTAAHDPATPEPAAPGDPPEDAVRAAAVPPRPRASPLAPLALVVSVISLGVSVTALLHSPSGTQSPTSANAATVTAPTVPPASTVSPTVTAPTAGSLSPSTRGTLTESSPGPTASYRPAYARQTLTLRPGDGCNKSRLVDLDEPAVGVADNAADFRYRWSCARGTPGSLDFTDARLAGVRGSDATPQDCATAIRTAPVNTRVTPSQDLALCAVTNGTGTPGKPKRAKIALVVVNTVGADSSVVLTVRAWEIPR